MSDRLWVILIKWSLYSLIINSVEQESSAIVVSLSVLEAFVMNSVDPDRTVFNGAGWVVFCLVLGWVISAYFDGSFRPNVIPPQTQNFT